MIRYQTTKPRATPITIAPDADTAAVRSLIRDECTCDDPDPKMATSLKNGTSYWVECQSCGEKTEPARGALKGEVYIRVIHRWNRLVQS